MSVHLIAGDTDPQRTAADPQISAFVRANAGSGKTKTLIDRVARLLLDGAKPETILCVTYTKAAAAEMQRRLYRRLGDWSVMEDDRLTQELAELEGRRAEAYDARRLSEARALFAQALETPGGLKIQTIHAFCEKLLRRFPLEAGVSPGFRVMDDAASAAVAAAARAAVAGHALHTDGPVAQAYARMSVELDYGSFQQMFFDFEARRGKLQEFLTRDEDGLGGAIAWAWAAAGVAAGETPDAVEAEARFGFDRGLWRAAAELLNQGGKADQKNAGLLAAVAAAPEPTLADMLGALFTEGGEGTPAKWVATTKGLASQEGLRARLREEQERLELARERHRGARVAVSTIDALSLAHAYLTAYAIEKQAFGGLDFADLIEKTKALLTARQAAAWVLFKLDGGIDHILVDEAQDTAPDQWDIVRALTGEFFAGDGRPRLQGGLDRSLFVVGDEKQSIYSFQGADPARLVSETTRYVAEIRASGRRAELAPLRASWRSTGEVLSFVDAVFATGVPPLPEPALHPAMREGERGCVDLWPLVEEPAAEERTAWTAPLDVEGEASANKQLARAIACEIGETIGRGDAVFDRAAPGGKRPATYGDVLILVRKRGPLFEEILRALKQAEVPVAGADRLALSQHIIFDDLLALARFALFPDDDLTLAALLRSPFCDLDDAGLYRLAHGRKGTLWSVLTARASEDPAWTAAAELLGWAIAEGPAQRPFEFYAQALARRDAAGRSMRARLLRRLGAEAEDALEEFLAQVIAAEGRSVHDLESLAADFARLDIVVKRELEGGRDEVRVMTAHGSKGLEAPIVFLPETTSQQSPRGSPLMETPDGGFLWCAAAKGDCAASAEARELRARREEEEALRLLYVALTRARERLVICGKRPANRKEENLKGWWAAIRDGFAHAQIAPHVRAAAGGGIDFQRYGPDPEPLGAAAAGAAEARYALPAWAAEKPRAEAFARYASPSDLGEGAKVAAPSPLAETAGLGRFRRGDLIHRLLQILPDLPPEARPAGAAALLARQRDLTEAQRAEMAAAALAVLNDARFAEVFGAGSRAEVAIAGTASALPAGLKISGRIDRLVVLPERVLVADFKTNRPSPDAIEDADPAYLRQMALYAAVLAEIFPGRRIEAALIWTDGPKLMPVPEKLMAASLADLGRGS